MNSGAAYVYINSIFNTGLVSRPFLIHDLSAVCNKSNKTYATLGAATTYTFGTHVFTFGFKCCSIFRFLHSVLQIIVCSLSFGHCIVYPPSIYSFWLLLWYLPSFKCLFAECFFTRHDIMVCLLHLHLPTQSVLGISFY